MDDADEGASSAGAYYSQDFEWEALRDEVERMPEFVGQHGWQERDLLPSLPTVENHAGARENREEAPSTSTSWETFHTRHSRNLFFKERRYLTKEFPDLCRAEKRLLVLEVGCGTGSSVAPIVRNNKHAFVYACDCSSAALTKATEVVSNATEPSVSSFYPFLCDVSTSKLPDFLHCPACRRKNCQYAKTGTEWLGNEGAEVSHEELGLGFDSSPESRSLPGQEPAVGCCIGGVDIVTMIFTLSAIPVEKMARVVAECFQVLKPGGLLLFRDYGLYDMTMLRFAPRQRLSPCLYQRDDGTLSYFFSLERVRALLSEAGFREQELEYCCVQLMNRRKQVPMKRVWVHAKFRKPDQT